MLTLAEIERRLGRRVTLVNTRHPNQRVYTVRQYRQPKGPSVGPLAFESEANAVADVLNRENEIQGDWRLYSMFVVIEN
jgi:hypothetical protein